MPAACKHGLISSNTKLTWLNDSETLTPTLSLTHKGPIKGEGTEGIRSALDTLSLYSKGEGWGEGFCARRQNYFRSGVRCLPMRLYVVFVLACGLFWVAGCGGGGGGPLPIPTATATATSLPTPTATPTPSAGLRTDFLSGGFDVLE